MSASNRSAGIPAPPPAAVDATPGLLARLPELARGRAIVIDHFASRRCGVTIGDLRVRFGTDLGDTETADLRPLGGVAVRAEAELLSLLDGAELRLAGPAFVPRLALDLRRPEAWLDFLHSHPHSRR